MATSPASPGTDDTRRWPGVLQARSFLLTLFSIEVAVLVVTGIALFFVYRPSVAQAWSDVAGVGDSWDMAAAVRTPTGSRRGSRYGPPSSGSFSSAAPR